ncbi:hypothetical protein B447_04903 [Thauera sp. 27]|uniref:LPD38 domain-containing protein n=1 Tax=Thauera sp. 27 TaxID=305700 RepID=UPI0002CE6F7B|nr:LPD38 domain-containing protein [Thauera sp. 27]ENO82048.1 hypothetical protein B447_04903 [Thauera sp. 27]
MATIWDEFELVQTPAPAAQQSGERIDWDQFELVDAKAAPKQNTGLAGDLATDIKRGVQKLPGVLTGLADIPVAAVTGERYVSRAADALGEATGFQPGKWAEAAANEYSPRRKAGAEAIERAWQGGGAADIAGAYLSNPGNIAGLVAESLPSMVAGGLVGRAALAGAARLAPSAAAAPLAPVIAGAGGEGAMIAGQSMANISEDVDARRAAAASAGAGLVGAGLGVGGGMLARRLGVIDPETAIAGGVAAAGRAPMGFTRRLAGGATAEGLFEEMPQSVAEQAAQNWAEQNPIGEGVARAAVEGGIAGGLMGAGANVMPAGRAQQTQPPAIDPNTGPLSRAASLAQANQAAMTERQRIVDEEAGTGSIASDPHAAWSSEQARRAQEQAAAVAAERVRAAEQAAQQDAAETEIAGATGVEAQAENLDFNRFVGEQASELETLRTRAADSDGLERAGVRTDMRTARDQLIAEGAFEADQRAQQREQFNADAVPFERILPQDYDTLNPIRAGEGEVLDRERAPTRALPSPDRAESLQAPEPREAIEFRPRPNEPLRATPEGDVGTRQQFDEMADLRATRREQMRRAREQARFVSTDAEARAARTVPYTEQTAQREAERLSNARQEPFTVVPHPRRGDRFAVVPTRAVSLTDQAATSQTSEPEQPVPQTEAVRESDADLPDVVTDDLDPAEGEANGAVPGGTDAGMVEARAEEAGVVVGGGAGVAPSQPDVSANGDMEPAAGAFVAGGASAEPVREAGGGRAAVADAAQGQSEAEIPSAADVAQTAAAATESDAQTTEGGNGATGDQGARQPEAFVSAPDGSIDFGEITPEMAQAMMLFSRGEGGSGLTRDAIRQSIVDRFPGLAKSIDAMLKRGDQGKRGGVVVVERAEDLAGTFASKTGRTIDEARNALQMSVALGRRMDQAGVSRLRRVVQSFVDNKPFSGEWIKFGPTPAVLQMAGAQPLPVEMDPKKLADAAKPGRKHSLSEDAIVGAVEHLGDPIAVIESRTESGALVVLTEVLDKGRPVVVAVHLEPDGMKYSLNKIASIHARDNILGTIAATIRDGKKVLYVNEQKRQQFASETGLQLPLGASDLAGVGYKVLNENDLVKHETSSPVRFSEGGDIQGFFDPKSGLTFMVAPNLTAETAPAVLLHEATHGKQRGEIDRKALKLIENRSTRAKPLRDFLGRVSQRMEDAGESGNSAEAASYVVEQAVTEGRQAGFSAVDGKLLNWVDMRLGKPVGDIVRGFVAMIRAWALRNGFSFTPTVDDLVAIAQANVRAMARGDVAASAAGADGGFSVAPKTDSKAFRNWFGKSKIRRADGSPIVVMHGSPARFDAFDNSKLAGASTHTSAGLGHFFTRGQATAERYADGGTIYRGYLRMERPYTMQLEEAQSFESVEDSAKRRQELKRQGYDGVAMLDDQGKLWALVAFEPTQFKTTDNVGSFSPDDPRMRFSRMARSPSTIAAAWQAPEPSKMDSLIYTLQNKQVDLKRVVDAVKAQVGEIEDQWNPYLQEELFHGRSAKGVRDFLAHEMRPLLTQMRRSSVDMGELERYLHARHAPEANAHIAKINPNEPDLQDGGSGMTNQEAASHLAGIAPDRRRVLDTLARQVDAINAKTRQLMVDSGLETAETIQAWEAAYQHYVPLQREDVESGGLGVGQGYSVRGPASKRRTGSKKAVIDILANIALQRERTIVRAEKNRVAQANYALAIKAPNTDFWMPVNPDEAKAYTPAQQTRMVAELVGMGLDPADAENFVKEPVQRYVDPRTGLVAERINPALRGADNVLSLRIDGKDRYVFFNRKDERAQRMVHALKNLDADQLGHVFGVLAKLTRFFAAVNTQWNPVFGVVNLTRDTQAALLQLSTTPIRGSEKAVLKNVLPAMRGIYAALRAEREGEALPNSPWAQAFDEFRNEGGQTGYRDMFSNSQERADALAKELNPEGWMESPLGKVFTANGVLRVPMARAQKMAGGLFNWLSDYNDTLENAVRLSAYMEAKAKGLSNAQAASIAKNLTVNFNRKGQIATQAGALYAFFNAAMQGTTRMLQTLKGPAGRKIILGGLTLGALQAVTLAAAGFDDDEPPEFVRERSIVVPLGDGKYASIPMPLGFHVIPSTSRILTEWALSGFRDTTKRFGDFAALFADTFNPIGNAGWSMQTLAPTALDPLAALSENRDWTGKPIAQEDFNSLRPTPGFSRAKDTASEISKALAYWINLASGGTDYKPGIFSPTPDQIDYLIGQITGGVGREYLKTEQTAMSLWTGEELPPHKIPLLGRFYGDTSGQSSEATRFYNNLREINLHRAEIEGRRKDGGDVQGYLRDNPAARIGMAGPIQVEGQVRKLREAKRIAVEQGDTARVRVIDEQITMAMRRFNERVSAAAQ